MIVFDLHCPAGHRFEGWFGSGSDFTEQQERGLVTCPQCGSGEVSKAPMAPAVPAKSNQQVAAPPEQSPSQALPSNAPVHALSETQPVANTPMPAEMQAALQKLAKAQEKALKDSKWVGKDFAEQSREMHYGERDEAPIHGQASIEEAKALIDEGVQVAPLPFPLTPPDDLN